jgi:hypothetical protein
MPLRPLLKNKLMLQKHFNLQEVSIDNWPFWMLEENISIVNEIVEEEETNRKKQEEAQNKQMPNMDPSSMMRNMQNMTSNIPKYK